jgi:FMN phosphatase YigB (HAD superfamily)
MAPKPIGTVFFDLGDTLGTPELSPPPIHLVGFHVFPFVPDLLEQLRSGGLKLGIISNTGSDTGPKLDAILSIAGILASFNDTLRIYSADVGLTKADPAIFKLAAQRAGSPEEPATCLFVGEDPQERATAASAGLRVCPHPLLAAEVIDGGGRSFGRCFSRSAARTADRADARRRQRRASGVRDHQRAHGRRADQHATARRAPRRFERA